MASKTFTRQDEAHYVIYRWLNAKVGLRHAEAYSAATGIMQDMAALGLSVTKRRHHDGGEGRRR